MGGGQEMEMGVLDDMVKHLEIMLIERDVFEQHYGKNAGVFLAHLPALFRMFHRLTFDMTLPVNLRHKSASVAVYIAEHQDFVGEASQGVKGLIDDVWIAFRALQELLEEVPEERMAAHWRSDVPFEEVAALAPNVSSIDSAVPSRVLTLAKQFLGVDDEDDTYSGDQAT